MKNRQFSVIWKIDLEAETSEDAARMALEIQRDADSTATVFCVVPMDGEEEIIDLLPA